MKKLKYEDIKTTLNKKEIKQLQEAKKRKPIYDEDSPLLSDEELMEFKRVNRLQRNKDIVSIRVSKETLSKAKRYGKGYTSFLSRLLDLAINDKDMVKKCL